MIIQKTAPGPPIATAEEILKYLGEAIEENDLAQYIAYSQRVLAANWNSEKARWQVTYLNLKTGKQKKIEAGFLWMCQGYYRHSEGYTPNWPGFADYEGEVIHPQTWPEDFDGKTVLKTRFHIHNPFRGLTR